MSNLKIEKEKLLELCKKARIGNEFIRDSRIDFNINMAISNRESLRNSFFGLAKIFFKQLSKEEAKKKFYKDRGFLGALFDPCILSTKDKIQLFWENQENRINSIENLTKYEGEINVSRKDLDFLEEIDFNYEIMKRAKDV